MVRAMHVMFPVRNANDRKPTDYCVTTWRSPIVGWISRVFDSPVMMRN